MHLVNGRWLVSSSLRAQWDAVDTFLCVDLCVRGLALWCPKSSKVHLSKTLFLRETALVPYCGATVASLEISLGTVWCPRGAKVPPLGPLGTKKIL